MDLKKKKKKLHKFSANVDYSHYSPLFPSSQNSQTGLDLSALSVWLEVWAKFKWEEKKKEFPLLNRLGDSVFGHMSGPSSN